MQKQLEKKKRSVKPVPTESIVCEACNYVRKVSDTSPKWQCPCCQSAYVKVNKSLKARSDEKGKATDASLSKDQSKAKSASKKASLQAGAFGAYVGVISIMSGLGSTCARVGSNPVALGIGGVILVGSLLYLLSKLAG